jgi:hypothetical protein
MPAKLTTSGVTFSDSTVLNSKYGIVPQSSVSIFYQAVAPTGWTKSTTNNDKTLRVVSGSTGGTAGGTTSFSTIFPTSTTPVSVSSIPLSGSTGSTTLTEGQLPSHTHPNSNSFTALIPGSGDVGGGAGWTRISPGVTGGGPGSGGGSHTHPWSGTANLSTTFDLRLQYIDVIVCSFT